MKVKCQRRVEQTRKLSFVAQPSRTLTDEALHLPSTVVFRCRQHCSLPSSHWVENLVLRQARRSSILGLLIFDHPQLMHCDVGCPTCRRPMKHSSPWDGSTFPYLNGLGLRFRRSLCNVLNYNRASCNAQCNSRCHPTWARMIHQ